MCGSVSEQFEEALRETGLRDFNVVEQRGTPPSNQVHVYVSKQLGDREISHRTAISDAAGSDEWVDKTIAVEASEVGRQFLDMAVDTYEWGDNSIDISLYNGVWAKCRDCGRKERVAHPESIHEASLSYPSRDVDAQEVVQELEEYQRELLRLYLVGRVRHSCANRKV